MLATTTFKATILCMGSCRPGGWPPIQGIVAIRALTGSPQPLGTTAGISGRRAILESCFERYEFLVGHFPECGTFVAHQVLEIGGDQFLIIAIYNPSGGEILAPGPVLEEERDVCGGVIGIDLPRAALM
jgi:hypothetical protein